MLKDSEPIQSKARLITRRMFILTGVKLAVFFAIVGRLFYLQISENIKYRTLSEKNRLREWKVPPQRGIIKDFFGEYFTTADYVTNEFNYYDFYIILEVAQKHFQPFD